MVYTWGYDEFVKQAKKLQEMIASETDLRRRLYLEKVADATDRVFHKTFNKFTEPNISAKQRIYTISNTRLAYGRYYSIVQAFFEGCVDHLELADDISTKLENLDENGNFPFLQTGAKISQSKTLNLVRQFYSSFDKELYDAFLEVYNDRDGTLRFLDKSEAKDDKTDGNTIFLDGVKKNFITVYETTPLETYSCTVHEYGHAIQNVINPEVSYSDRDDFFMEVASIFPELVALYENKGKFSQLESAYALYTTCITYMDEAEFLTLHTPLINEWAEHKYVLSKKFFDSINEAFDIDKECFEKALAITLEEEGIYVISFAVALELFHIYKQDKKRALELFKGFLKYPAKEDILVYVMENFELNKHVSEEIGIILNDFSKKLEMRR